MDNLPEAVRAWAAAQGAGQITASQPVGGGCINNGARLKTSTGKTFFLKTNPAAPADMFAKEAQGLAALRGAAGGPRAPAALLVGADFLLLEDLAPAPPQPGYWERCGFELAALHGHTAPRFGFEGDNYIGNTPQPNAWLEEGFQFYAERRLLFQARLARQGGLLGAPALRAVEHLAQRLPELVPAQPASLLHGDLWSGNLISDAQGAPAVIDPAAYYGWAEAELAMTALFGGFPEAFYRAYAERRPLEKGFRQRFGLYNLYHLLNHLNLFGPGYLGAVEQILSPFMG